MDRFIARYSQNGIQKTVVFDKSIFDKIKAEQWLNSKGIQNFFLFFEPYAPEPFDDNHMLMRGDVGFDINVTNVMDILKGGKGIILDSFGGDYDEGLKIYDAVKLLGLNPSIGVLGNCASSAMQILLSTENRWATKHSNGLVHNPWMIAAGDDAEFAKNAKDLESSKLKLANLYSEVTAKPVEEMLTLMKEERFMNASEMLSFGFIKEIKTTINTITNLKDDEMKDKQELTEKVNAMEKVLNGIKNLFKDAPVAKNIILTEANGKEIEFPEIEDESQIAVGVTANIDGAPANGEFVMAGGMNDGKTLVFADGVLTEIKEPEAEKQPNEEMEALKAENESLKQQLEAQNKFRKTAEKQLNDMSAELSKFKDAITSGVENTITPPTENPNPPKKGFKYNK